MPVRVDIDGEHTEVEAGCTLFEIAAQLEVRVPTSCRGKGKCRECIVEIEQGEGLLSPPTEAEVHLDGPLRLSCQARLAGPEGALKCHTLRRGSIQIVESGDDISSHQLQPAVLRRDGIVYLDGEEIARTEGPVFGLAVDLGTTTVVARLVDLETGRTVGTSSFENPQRFGGSDVLARVQYDTEHPGQLLRRTAAGYLKHAIEDLGADRESLFEVVIAGNAAMRDLFFGLDVYSIGQMPYRSLVENEFLEGARETTAISCEGRHSMLPVHPRGRVYGMPLVGCHVGADTAACMLALDMFEEDRLVALMDLGTNTELILGRKGRLHAASCPAGPAFEGGAISCGMPALEGAVERVRLGAATAAPNGGNRRGAPAHGTVECRVIGGGDPLGICGSGLIDLVSELLRTGAMNHLGRLTSGDDRFTVSSGATDVYMTEQDISLLAQAKAANVAGLHLVHRDYGVDFGDVDVFYLAGGFAQHLDLGAARRIGLLPDLPGERLVRVGNAALEGATVALTSVPARRRLEQQVKEVHHIELETFPDFFHYFAEGVQFRSFDSHDQGPEPVR